MLSPSDSWGRRRTYSTFELYSANRDAFFYFEGECKVVVAELSG